MADDIAVLKELQRALAVSSQRYRSARNLPSRLFAVADTVSVLIQFLDALPGAKEHSLATPLVALNDAIADTMAGRRAALLTLRKPPNRPPEARAVQALKGFAAASMTLLMQSGLPRKEAAREVAKHLRRHLNRLPLDKTPTSQAVARWREAVTGRGQQSQARDRYGAVLAHTAKHSRPAKKELAVRLLTTLPDVIQAPDKFPRKTGA